MAMLDMERRKIERFDLNLKAVVQAVNHRGNGLKKLITRDASSAGAFFLTDHQLPIGTKVKVDLELPGGNTEVISPTGVRIATEGSVVRTDDSGLVVCFDNKYKIIPP